jgi:hypothetical protein
MEFVLLFVDRKDAPPRKSGGMAEMQKFAAELAARGTLRRGGPLAAESAGARVRVREGKAIVSDGPFAESKEFIGGFWILDVESPDEAIDIARRTPHAREGIVDVHATMWRDVVDDPGQGVPFLFAFQMEAGLTDPDGSKMKEMIAFGDALKRKGHFLETAPLPRNPAPVRVAPPGLRPLATDGPFAEMKELVGGYSVIRAADRTEAIEIATRYPHARWGPVEVREIGYFDPVRARP